MVNLQIHLWNSPILQMYLPFTGEGGCAWEGCGWLRNYLSNWVRWYCFHRLRKRAGYIFTWRSKGEPFSSSWADSWFVGKVWLFCLIFLEMLIFDCSRHNWLCRSEYQWRINSMCRQFVREIYDGQIFIKLKNGMHFPGLDLWVSFNTVLFLLLFGALNVIDELFCLWFWSIQEGLVVLFACTGNKWSLCSYTLRRLWSTKQSYLGVSGSAWPAVVIVILSYGVFQSSNLLWG